MKPVYTIKDASSKIRAYCAYQERCHKEVTDTLEAMGLIPEAVLTIVADLIKDGFLDEGRFAKTFAGGKHRIKKWGWLKIKRELLYRNISKANIEVAFTEISENYLEVLDQVARDKASKIKEISLQKKQKKLIDYLLYRGWEAQIVRDKVREILP